MGEKKVYTARTAGFRPGLQWQRDMAAALGFPDLVTPSQLREVNRRRANEQTAETILAKKRAAAQ